MKLAFALLLALVWATPSPAQHAHGHKGPNGGQMEDVAGVHLELLTSGQTLTLNVFDEANKAVSTAGFTASALISLGSDRETLSLAPSGTNSLSGQTKKPISAGAAISVTLKTAAGKTGQARFKK
jgi:hypothetical protein